MWLCLYSDCYIDSFCMETKPVELHKYARSLLESFLLKLQMLNASESIWINFNELYQSKYNSVKKALFGRNKLFESLGIDAAKINLVQQFEWVIQREELQNLKDAESGNFILSPSYQYMFDGRDTILFHMICYGKYSEESPNCAIFVKFDVFPKSMKRLRIEIDIKCHKKKEYRRLLKTQSLSPEHPSTGFQAFRFEKLSQNKSIRWVLGMKIFKTEQFDE